MKSTLLHLFLIFQITAFCQDSTNNIRQLKGTLGINLIVPPSISPMYADQGNRSTGQFRLHYYARADYTHYINKKWAIKALVSMHTKSRDSYSQFPAHYTDKSNVTSELLFNEIGRPIFKGRTAGLRACFIFNNIVPSLLQTHLSFGVSNTFISASHRNMQLEGIEATSNDTIVISLGEYTSKFQYLSVNLELEHRGSIGKKLYYSFGSGFSLNPGLLKRPPFDKDSEIQSENINYELWRLNRNSYLLRDVFTLSVGVGIALY